MYEVTATIFITVKKGFVRPTVEHAEVVRQSNATSVEKNVAAPARSVQLLRTTATFWKLQDNGARGLFLPDGVIVRRVDRHGGRCRRDVHVMHELERDSCLSLRPAKIHGSG